MLPGAVVGALAGGYKGTKKGIESTRVNKPKSSSVEKKASMKNLAAKATGKVQNAYGATMGAAKKNLQVAKDASKPMKERAIAGGKLLGAGAAAGGTVEMARRKMMSKEASKMQAIRDAAGRLKGSVAGSAKNFRDGVKKDYSAAMGKPMTKVKGNIISAEKGNLKDRAMAAGRLGLKTVVPAGVAAEGGRRMMKKKED